MTDLGREIPITDGRKPEWLADDEVVVYSGANGGMTRARLPHWPNVTAIRLRADHPFYKQESPRHKITLPPDAIIGKTVDIWQDGKPVDVAPSFDTDKYVLVERMTADQLDKRLCELTDRADFEEAFCLLFRSLGIIKPDPTPLERYMEQYPEDDRDIVERVLAWKEGL